MGLVVLVRRWWLVVLVVAVLTIGGAVACAQYRLSRSQDTVEVLLVLDRNGTGQATITVRRGRLPDPGPFGERVAMLLTPTADRLRTRLYPDLLDRDEHIDVPLVELAVPVRLDTQTLQEAVAAEGFRWLVVGIYSDEHWQVVPGSASRAGHCFGNALSCEWRLTTRGSPLKIQITPL